MNGIEPELLVDTLALTRGMRRLDDVSYEQFFSRYYRRLWAYLAILSDDREEDIEEILQQVFEKVVLHIKEFNEEGAFWAWLATIARNCYLDSRRKRHRLDTFKESLAYLVPQLFPPASNRQLIDNWTLEQKMMGLSADERRLIYGKYFLGESYRELALHFSVTEKAVELRLHRARKKLRQMLTEQE